MIYGYARVSTQDQNLGMQIDALKIQKVDTILTEKISGKETLKPVLDQLLEDLVTGDTLVVWKLDRLGRNTIQLLALHKILQKKEIILISLTETIDTSNFMGMFYFQFTCCLAEMERNIISQRTRAGLASAKEKGIKCGRRPGLNEAGNKKADQAANIYKKYFGKSDLSINDICLQVGVSRATLYKYLKMRGVKIKNR